MKKNFGYFEAFELTGATKRGTRSQWFRFTEDGTLILAGHAVSFKKLDYTGYFRAQRS